MFAQKKWSNCIVLLLSQPSGAEITENSSGKSDSDSERKLGYCGENLSCATYNSLGNLEKRITIRNAPVNGTLYVEQLIKDDILTFTCSVQRKQNKDPLVYQVNVSSSVHCE